MTATPEAAAPAALLWKDEAGVRTITLNRPERLNAIDLAMIEQLEGALTDARDRAEVRVVLLRGAGRAFCAGDDVAAQSAICLAGEAALRAQLDRLQNISRLLTLGDKLTVAAVHGWAVGAGFSWVLNCDFRVWGEAAGAFLPEVTFGTFVTGGATVLLPRLVGWQMAAELLLTGAKLRASDPRVAGLVHALHAAADLPGAASALARRLADLPRPAAARMKAALVGSFEDEFRAALHRETEACVATTLDPATLQRMRAAIAKG